MDIIDFVGRFQSFIGGVLTWSLNNYNVGLRALLLRSVSGPEFCGVCVVCGFGGIVGELLFCGCFVVLRPR